MYYFIICIMYHHYRYIDMMCIYIYIFMSIHSWSDMNTISLYIEIYRDSLYYMNISHMSAISTLS